MAIDPFDPSIIYLGTGAYYRDPPRILKSEDGGRTWAAAELFQGDDDFKVIAIDGARRVYAGTWHNGLWRSDDLGATWWQIGPDLPETIREIRPGRYALYVLAGDRGVYRSTNGGETWSSAGLSADARFMSLELDPSDRMRIIAGTAYVNRLYAGDHRSGWNQIDLGTSVPVTANGGVTIIRSTKPPYSNFFFAGTFSDGVFMSRDAGDTWNRWNTGLPVAQSSNVRPLVDDILADPASGRILMVAGGEPYYRDFLAR